MFSPLSFILKSSNLRRPRVRIHMTGPEVILRLTRYDTAANANATRFGELSPYFLTTADLPSRSGSFYYGEPGITYDQALVELDEENKDIMTVGESVTRSYGTRIASDYRGPVAIFTGQHDIVDPATPESNIGDCGAGSASKIAKDQYLFPNAIFHYGELSRYDGRLTFLMRSRRPDS
jgi:hypothetical protein